MLLIWAVIVGLLVGLVRFRSFAYLRQLKVRFGVVAIAALVIQLLAIRALEPGPPQTFDLRVLLFFLGMLVVLGVLILNAPAWPALRLAALGCALNVVAMLPQGGYMPVEADAYRAAGLEQPGDDLSEGARLQRSKEIVLARERTPLWALSDIFPIREPRLLRGVYSVGDVLVALGVGAFAAGLGIPRTAARMVGVRASVTGGEQLRA